MKYLVIAIVFYAFGCFYGYLKGYVKGYDEAKECYTSFYEKLRKVEKETFEMELEYERSKHNNQRSEV